MIDATLHLDHADLRVEIETEPDDSDVFYIALTTEVVRGGRAVAILDEDDALVLYSVLEQGLRQAGLI